MIPAAFRSVRAVGARRAMSSTVGFDLYNPTEDHQVRSPLTNLLTLFKLTLANACLVQALRDMVRRFTEDNIEPQALEFDRDEKFNHALWKEVRDTWLHCFKQKRLLDALPCSWATLAFWACLSMKSTAARAWTLVSAPDDTLASLSVLTLKLCLVHSGHLHRS